MKILLLNLYYPPDTSATARMAATLVGALRAKHDVTIVCGRPSYDPTERRPWRLWQTELSGSVEILRVGSTDYPRFWMKKRVTNYLTYVALAVPRSLFVPCDVVLAMTDPPFEGIVGAFVALLKCKPYVYNIRDLYPDMALGGRLIRPGPLARVWEWLHRWALRRARCVIVLGDDMRERIIAKGVEAARVVVARDGIEIAPPGAPAPALDPEVIRMIRGDFRFVLLHAGNLGFYGAWETLIEAARELEDDGVGFVFVGEGAEKPRIEAAANGCKAIRTMPFFPAPQVPSVLAAADAHLITVRRGLEGVVVPSKLYGILAAGKPIVTVAPDQSEPARIARACGCGLTCNPDRPGELAALIRELVRDSQFVHQMGQRARSAAPEYDRVFELAKFLRVIEEVAEG